MKVDDHLKLLVITILLVGSAIPCFAQHKIKGRVIDENKEPLPYTQVVLLNPADSTLQYYDVTDKLGLYEINHVRPGTFLMQITFIGKETIYEIVTLPSEHGENFEDKVMQDKPIESDDVVVTAEYIPIKIEQDTVTFNAKAFKTREGAVVEELLEEIPGIEVDKTGNIKALGEDVTKVLVDGKEFFSGDTKVATKNLPAKAVEKVKVYDKKSEGSEFMGIDDGIQNRTIDLLLNEDSKKGCFGNLESGGGTKSKDNYHYKIKGNVYRFSSAVQAALLGMANNVNDFGFKGKDHNIFGSQINGLNNTGAGGLNLSYNSNNYNRYYISYLGSSIKSDHLQTTSTENFLQNGSYYQDSEMVRDETDTPHNIRYGIHHRFNKNHNMIIKGNISISSNNYDSQVMTDSRLNDALVNSLDNTTDNHSKQNSFSVHGNDIIKLNDDKTQLKTDVYVSHSKNSSELDWINKETFYQTDSITIDDQYQDNTNENRIISFDPTLVQKISKLWTVHTNVHVGSNKRELNREYGIFNTSIDSLSPDFNTSETFVHPKISLQRATDKTYMTFSIGLRWIKFDKVLNNSTLGKSDYVYFTPRFHYRNNYRSGRRIEAGYNTSVNLPGLSQLLPVTNTVNQFAFYKGNIGLKPEYRHNAHIQWSLFDAFSFMSFFTRLNAGYTKDKISISQTVNENLTKMNTPVNVAYNYHISSYNNFSTPIRPLGITLNAELSETWNKGMSIVNSEDNIQTVFVHAVDVNLENRRQDKLDVKVGGSVRVTDANYSIAKAMNNVYYNMTYYTDIYFTPNDQWTFGTETNIVTYNSESFKETVSIPLVSASIRYFFGRVKRAGIILEGHDLLNKFSNFQQTNGPNFIMEQDNNTIGRYMMLRFMYRIGAVLR